MSANQLAQTISHLSDNELKALSAQGFFTTMIQKATAVALAQTKLKEDTALKALNSARQ